tara:strand:+ start:148 stop:579 length:432 start_codon:yes stop_codon:yes gene_type:complete
MPIKSFRGRIDDGEQQKITLHTRDGSTGYKIKKLQIIAERPGHTNVENLLKVWSEEQSTAPDEYVDFSDQRLLAVAYYANHASNKVDATTIIFDNVVFNQDIFINHKDIDTGEACNYHIELEQVKLDLNENTVATLRDIRNLA